MNPVMRAGFTNQLICFQELILVARELNATVCWPRANLDGVTDYVKQQVDTVWDTLLDREYTRDRLLEVYGVRMVESRLDQELCDYAYNNQVIPT